MYTNGESLKPRKTNTFIRQKGNYLALVRMLDVFSSLNTEALKLFALSTQSEFERPQQPITSPACCSEAPLS